MTGVILCLDQFEGTPVRTFLIDNKPWFVLSDVCSAAGVKQAATVKKRLDQADVATNNIWSEATKQSYKVTIVNEAGLYDVILDSRKPQAKRFRRCVNQFRGFLPRQQPLWLRLEALFYWERCWLCLF